MKKTILTNKHFCFVIFLEMNPKDFSDLLETNEIMENLTFLKVIDNKDIYQEAKDLLLNKQMDSVQFDFDYDTEPFVFNKYINGKLDRAYKICIFEHGIPEAIFSGKTSNVYCEGQPLFFDPDGNMIKPSLN